MAEQIRYIHDEEHHNMIAPEIIVPFLIKNIQPKSVVDVGCGIGTFLKVFSDNGIDDILGVDGEWTDKGLLAKYIDLNNYKVVDLEQNLVLNRRFDLAISLEVAEHLKENSADIMVKNLANLSDVIVFSAAFPGQGGQNHVNEQWPTYWQRKFNKHGYKLYDLLRPIFWENGQIPAWYRQNIFLYIKTNTKEEIILRKFLDIPVNSMINIVHPEYFNDHLTRSLFLYEIEKKLDVLIKGKEKFPAYLKMVSKFFLRKFKLYNK